MASINITVQSLLNAGEYDPYTVDNATTVGTFRTTIGTSNSWDTTWFSLAYNGIELDDTKTLAFYNIINGSQLRIANKIARLTTLEDRQVAKLTLAQQERLALSNPYPYYDISELPTYYQGNVVVDNPNPSGLIQGRPWVP
jgi:hypothetical protein